MKDFEKFLTDLQKPVVEVPAFRERLRRELLSESRTRADARLMTALRVTGAAAAVLLVVVATFVARPAIPQKIHAALVGTQTPNTIADGTPAQTAAPAQVLVGQPTTMPVDADRRFVETWSARQPMPVSVRSIESQRLLSVRQFELTDGKRMLVFSEFGTEKTPRTQSTSPASSGGRLF